MIVNESEGQGPEEIRKVVSLLFRSAKTDVKLSTALTTDLINGARPEMEAAITRVKSFDVWLDSRVDVAEKKDQFPWLLDNKKVGVFKSRVPIPHWIIIDGRDFRIEKPHAPTEFPRKNMTIIDCRPDIAEELIRQFKEFCANSDPV